MCSHSPDISSQLNVACGNLTTKLAGGPSRVNLSGPTSTTTGWSIRSRPVGVGHCSSGKNQYHPGLLGFITHLSVAPPALPQSRTPCRPATPTAAARHSEHTRSCRERGGKLRVVVRNNRAGLVRANTWLEVGYLPAAKLVGLACWLLHSSHRIPTGDDFPSVTKLHQQTVHFAPRQNPASLPLPIRQA